MLVIHERPQGAAGGAFSVDLDPAVVRRIPRALALRFDVLPLSENHNELTVALPEPDASETLDRLRLATGMQVRAVRMPQEVIRRHLAEIFAPTTAAPRNDRADEAPAIRMLDSIHDRALLAHASDLHIEPGRTGGRVRQRVDGMLHDVLELGAEVFTHIVSRIKLLAGLDIADKRQPQDGRYTIEMHGRHVDARVSSIPTTSGEKLVIRLLDHQVVIPSLENLGVPPQYLKQLRYAVHAPNGFIVACGPTGSGKTTTLYAALSERNVDSDNVCSVEDPVEIPISGIAQVQVNPRAGVTFASALRSLLRQDPNVIMIGEMRDSETADVAVSAALSGQLVLTTLHSNDAVRTVDRLVDLGVNRHAIASALTGIVAQRLVRKLCASCKTGSHEPAGCAKCHGSGYRGRTGIFEFLFLTDELRDLIAEGASSVAVATAAMASGYVPMSHDALAKVRAGVTSRTELSRVLGSDAW